MPNSEYAELVARVQTCIAAGANEQARILVRRIHLGGRVLPYRLYATLPFECYGIHPIDSLTH